MVFKMDNKISDKLRFVLSQKDDLFFVKYVATGSNNK